MGRFSKKMWAVLFFIALVSATTQDRVYPEYSEMLTPDQGWSILASKEQPTLRYTVAIKQRNLKKFKSFFDKVSDPQSKMYGKYLTVDEVRDRVAPSHHTVKFVKSFFEKHGFKNIKLSRSGDFLTVHGTPKQVNEALQTDVQLWVNEDKKMVWRSVVPYSFPEAVGKHVDFVSGVHHFPKKQKSVFYSPEDTPMIGPSQLRLRYNVTDNASNSVNNTQAVAEFQGQYYSPKDLDQFFQQYVPGSTNDTVTKVIGPNQAGDPGVEAELDIQVLSFCLVVLLFFFLFLFLVHYGSEPRYQDILLFSI